jgi:hypothetical protein
MDLAKIIRDLLEDKAKLETVIVALEDLQRNAVQVPDLPKPKRKGRKPMPPEERQEVSDRMKRYWARYRAERVEPAVDGSRKSGKGRLPAG